MSDPVALVTGASRGIGRRLCVDLARAGYDVACAARSSGAAPGRLPGTIEDTAAEVQAAGRRSLALPLDVRDEAAVAALAERLRKEWGRCNLLINNAAVAPPRAALEDGVRRWRLAVDVNLNGPFYLIYHLRTLLAEAAARVVNVSSLAAVTPSFGRASYTTTKAALEAMTGALAHDLRGRIALNALRIDVPVWSEGFAATLPEEHAFAFEDPVVVSDAVLWLARQPLDVSGQVLSIGELRTRGVVRPQTRVGRQP